MDIIKVVCGIVYDNDKVFICRRKEEKFLASFWEFPGGKVEQNESDQTALKRELQEELEMEINIIGFVGQSNYDYGNFQIELLGYLCDLINYDGKLTDHDAYEWVDISELDEYKLAPADIPLARIIESKK